MAPPEILAWEMAGVAGKRAVDPERATSNLSDVNASHQVSCGSPDGCDMFGR
jgi:hypothetical protein